MLTEESGDVKGEEGTLAGDSDVAYSEGSSGILDDAVGTAAEGAEAGLVGKGKEKLNGAWVIDDAVDGDFCRKADQFVGDLFGHNCKPPLLYFLWRNNNNRKRAVMAEKIIDRWKTPKTKGDLQ